MRNVRPRVAGQALQSRLHLMHGCHSLRHVARPLRAGVRTINPFHPGGLTLRERNKLENDAGADVGTKALYVVESLRLLRFFRRRVGKGDEAADLVQETFVRFAGHSTSGSLRNPAAYLQRIARNLLIDRYRRRDAAPSMVNIDDADIVVRSDQADALEAAELMSAYEEAIGNLPPRTREVFLLHRVGELSYTDVAARLGISVRTVEWHIGEALVRIRRALDRR